MTNYNLLNIFYQVACCKNITKASNMLYISQPAVSASIKQLELQLDCKLLERKNKGVELTTLGQMLFENISTYFKSINNFEKMVEDFKNGSKGIVRIGTTTSNLDTNLQICLEEYVITHKDVKIVIRKEKSRTELLKKLQNKEIDLIFVDDINMTDKNILPVAKYDITYNLIGNNTFYEQCKNIELSKSLSIFNNLIIPAKNNQSRVFIDKYLLENGIAQNQKYEFDNYKMIYEFVKNGIGIAFVNSNFYKKQIENKEIFILFDDLYIKARQIVALINSENQNPSLEDFIDVLKQNEKIGM